MFGWSRDKLEGLTMPHLTPRYVMQYFATDLFRNKFHPDIWVKIVENKLNNITNTNIVISDCRFENEINMILRLGGKIIQVYRNPPNWFYNYKKGENPE